ncbi:phospholipase D family protein [Saccharopolyspora griseoalba]|uniref:Phospholipase D family protein n=1 Tax=Saccharopolyspora griseoalba TaxID=1431848 RepID=A0ABW2LMZ1_9PSEU
MPRGANHRAATAPVWFLSSAERGNPCTDLTAWTGGNAVRTLIDGEECFHRIAAELSDVGEGDQVYFAAWAGDPTERLTARGSAIGELMRAALDAGASVRGLFWAPLPGGKPDYVRENEEFADLLRRRGGVALFDRRVRLLGSHHQKFVVIRRPNRPAADVAFLGGIDPCPSRRDDDAHRGDPQVQDSIAAAFGDRPPWHDVQIAVRGPAVAEVEVCFRERWQDVRAAPLDSIRRSAEREELPAQLPAPPRCGGHAVQLLRTYPRKVPAYRFAPRGERSIARGYAKALANARDHVYVEDQFLWSPVVAETFAEALRSAPELRLVAILPHQPDKDDPLQLAVNAVAQRRALDLLEEAGGERVDFFELVNHEHVPIYVHSKLCLVDDTWATAGSANLNRRSWTYDSELAAAVADEQDSGESPTFAREFRLRLWREHLQRAEGDEADLLDARKGIGVLRRSAADLEAWYASGRIAPRPPGHLRLHHRPAANRATRAWVRPLARTIVDPDGRPRKLRRNDDW